MSIKSIQVILLAAGKSTRLGGAIAKPWCSLAGKPVLEHSLEYFAKHKLITSGVIVVSENALDDGMNLAQKYGWQAIVGGSTRAFSVKAGLEALSLDPPDYVFIHDSARPFLKTEVINNQIKSLLEGSDAVIPALPIADSLKKTKENKVASRINRDEIRRIQTPQAFSYSLIKSCHDKDQDGLATDDSTLVEEHGAEVKIIQGHILMDKITTHDDLEWARLIANGMTVEEKQKLTNSETRTATGFDVHKFSTKAGPLIIGGVSIPHEFSFEAHSDGDVALHALTDAIFGLTANGDIGVHFPPSDNKWKNKDSSFFLIEAQKALHQEGGQLSFVDITIIAENPKIGPHRDKMRERIADLLQMNIKRVSIKATTSEGLGFTGREEGIAVQATTTAQFTSENNLPGSTAQ